MAPNAGILMYRGSVGIALRDSTDKVLVFKKTRASDFRQYVYPYMLKCHDKFSMGLHSAGFWKDHNWMVMLF